MSAIETTPARLSRRARTATWLRRTHGWLGLWGALLGLLFGFTGIIQDHRALLKLPLPRPQESTVQMPLPTPAPEDADALADWLQQALNLAKPASRVKTEDAHPVAWGDRNVQQPEHWSAMFGAPRYSIQADYWVGNNFVTVKRSDNGLLATLSNLHKGIGLGPGWVLLADSVAGSLILLSLTGLSLWMLTRRTRVAGALVAGLALLLAAGIVAGNW